MCRNGYIKCVPAVVCHLASLAVRCKNIKVHYYYTQSNRPQDISINKQLTFLIGPLNSKYPQLSLKTAGKLNESNAMKKSVILENISQNR